MNPVDLVAKRKQLYESRLAQLCYQRYQMARKIEELDRQIASEEALLSECQMAMRDFGTYMAVEAARKETEVKQDA